MKKTFLGIILGLFTFLNVNAQKIEIKKVLGSNVYLQNGKRLTLKKITNLMEGNNKALAAIKKAKTNNVWSSIIGGAGGALVGFPIGTAIGGGDAKWELAGVGAGLILVGIPLNSAYNKQSKKAIDLYNESLPDVSSSFQPEFSFNFKGTSLGISMSF